MKPNFALNLSHEGISLLHRAKTGWLRVGEVALDDPDLNAKLQVLRRTASDLENGGLTSKLVIPNSQILYTEMDVTGHDTAARISQIRDGLVGLTPYDVSDLVFDWRMDGKRAQVAVVARDTLREAEVFATEFRFNPVSFVAVPVNGSFKGEPYFGPTRHAASLLAEDETIEPDTQQIKVLGSVATELAANPEDLSGQEAAPEQAPETTQRTAKTSGAEVPAADAPADSVSPPAASTPKPQKTDAPEDPAAQGPSTDGDADRGNGSATADPDLAIPAVTFASRRSASMVPGPVAPLQTRIEARFTLAAGQETTSPSAGLPIGSVTAASLEPEAPEAVNGATDTGRGPAFGMPGQARGASDAPLYPSPGPARQNVPPKSPAGPRAKPPEPKKPAPDTSSPNRTPMAMTSPHTADVIDPKDKATEQRRLARQAASDAKSTLVGTFGKLSRGTIEGARRMGQKSKAVAASASEAEALTVFGARGQSHQRGKPRHLGLILTLLLLLALAVLALWSTYFMPELTSGLFDSNDQDQQVATPAAISQPQPLDLSLTSQGASSTAVAPTDPAPAQSPIEAAVEAAIAETPSEPLAPQPDAIDPVIAPNPDTPTDFAALLPPIVLAPAPQLDPAAPAALPQGEPAVTVSEPIVSVPERQPPPTPAEAEARYAATGIWQLDPEPLIDVPGGGDHLEDIYIASIDPTISGADAVALPDKNVLLTDTRPPALTPPTPLGTRFDFDARGLVRATPEGAVSPEGVPVFSGKPSVAPGPRPASLRVPVDETRLILDERIQSVRPPLRPGGLSESNERARLGGFSSSELAAIRPAIRPLSLQEQRGSVFAAPGSETETASVATDPVFVGEDATALAVVASRTPPVRPSGFASLVERALQEASQSPPEPLGDEIDEPEVLASAVAAPRMPPVPSRASVAKQATITNALNLGKVNLIGIYGSPSQRRALVRLSSGKYVKVEVGDKVDGGRVSAIGDSELRYVKSGRNITLKMPKS